jgi:erythronate-4-phosphate dehydrogenase
MSPLKIVADENIPYVREAFAGLGSVTAVSGRALSREDVRGADLLLVRSVTKVGPALLDGTPVRFAGTATIGTDHVDLDGLAARGIAFAAAPGSNANSVAEYVTAALCVLSLRLDRPLAGMKIGIVGAGNVGSRLAGKAEALGMQVTLNDPPLARETGDPRYRPLEEALQSDVVTLHVPLTDGGEDATRHMADNTFFERMLPGAVFLNTSRGGVTDPAALAAALDGGRVAAAVLDVWEGEPAIDMALLDRVTLGTPHIAGYSFDGKVAGTVMLYRAACAHLDVEPTWDPAPLLPSPPVGTIVLPPDVPDEAAVRQAVRTLYAIEADDANLRAIAEDPPAERAAAFDRLRKEYPVRREFHNTRVAGASDAAARVLAGLGFAL